MAEISDSQTPKAVRIGKITIPHQMILAPMCGITLQPFRQICKEFGAGLVFNQMVSAKALTMMDKKSLRMLSYVETERPIGMQLFGNDAAVLAEASKIIEDKNPDVIDLNLGCPAKKIVNDGGGSALLTDLVKLGGILSAMRKAIQGTFTIKVRAGWDEDSKNALTVAKIAEDEGVDAIAIHARTRTQGYSGKADWSYIKMLKESTKLPIIGNGDIETAEDAWRMLRETGCDAVMTGRGAFAEPWIFENFVNKTERQLTPHETKTTVLKQYHMFMEYFGADGGIKLMRKFVCAYTKGLRGGSSFRNEIVRMNDWVDIQKRIDSFYDDAFIENSN